MNNQISEPENLPPRGKDMKLSVENIEEKHKPKGKPKWLYYVLGALLVVVLIVIYYVYSILDFADNIHTVPDNSQFNQSDQAETDPVPKWEGCDRVNILLLGGDARGLGKNDTPRSDSMIVASIDPV